MLLKNYFYTIFALYSLFMAGCSYAKDEAVKSSPWLLVIVAQDSNHAKTISLCASKSWRVELQNVSSMPQRLWSDSNSWGYSILSFIVKDANGKTYDIKRKARDWRKNYPGYLTIESAKSHILTPELTDDTWEFSSVLCTLRNAKIQAIITIPEDSYAHEYGVWYGRIESVEYSLN